jgi:hypothetical protein
VSLYWNPASRFSLSSLHEARLILLSDTLALFDVVFSRQSGAVK